MLLTGIWNEIWQAALAQSGLEWLALLANLAYVLLATLGNRWCWLFGGIGAIAMVIVLSQANLYSDALLNVYYIGMAVYGWITWKAYQTKNHVKIEQMSAKDHGLVFAVGTGLSLVFGLIFSQWNAAFPYVDGATTAFSFLATLLVAKRYLQNWIYWIVIDLVSIGVYYVKELYLVAFLFIVYTIMAVIGWYAWQRMIKIKNPSQE